MYYWAAYQLAALMYVAYIAVCENWTLITKCGNIHYYCLIWLLLLFYLLYKYNANMYVISELSRRQTVQSAHINLKKIISHLRRSCFSCLIFAQIIVNCWWNTKDTLLKYHWAHLINLANWLQRTNMCPPGLGFFT